MTHLYEFAQILQEHNAGDVLFLRADREADGTRTFRLREGDPLETSFGEDLYETIFGTGRDASDAGSPKAHPEFARGGHR